MPAQTVLDAHIAEHERLVRLSRQLAAFLGSEGWPCLDRLDASLATDRDLQSLTGAIRSRYLRELAAITADRWRTPPDGIAMPFPGSDIAYSYTYDRQHPPKSLEARLSRDDKSGVMLCSSGMAALNVVFQAFNHLLDRGRTLAVYGSYFETLSLLRIGPFSHRFKRARSEKVLSEILKSDRVGILLVEPVHYDWALTVTHWPEIIAALSELDDPPIVILDTTLTANCAEQARVLKQLQLVAPVVMTLRSGIKLDQQGLEFSNLGIVEYRSDNPKLLGTLNAALKTCRSICGATLTWGDACALAPEPFFGPASLRSYSQCVFDTARDLADRLGQVGDLFASVSHPDPPWPAPLVILELSQGGADNYRDLATLLDREQSRRGLHWQMSGSFGFRTQRYETILPEELLRPGETHDGALKIASGCYAGARQGGIVDLLQELSNYPDLQTARQIMERRHYAIGSSIRG